MRTGWRDARFAVIDIETTGLDPAVDEILSIGLVPVDEGRIRVGGALYRTLRADREPTEDTILVHGIRPMDVRGGQDPATAWAEVVAALHERVVVVHVQWVERTFLTPVLRAHGGEFPTSVVDTDVLMRRHLLREGRPASHAHVALGEAAAELGLPVHRPHHALGDALTTAQLFLGLATRYDPGREARVTDLTRRRPDEWWERAYATVLRRLPAAGP